MRGDADFLPFELKPRDERVARFLIVLLRRVVAVFLRELAVYRSGENGDAAILVERGGLDSELPTLLIANHPNGLIDAVVIYLTAGQTLRAVAKITLWNQPVLRPFLKFAGAVPVMRTQDHDEIAKGVRGSAKQLASNSQAMDLVARALCRHSCIIFPEGLSHEQPAISQFKTGGARMLLAAVALFARERQNPNSQLKIAAKLRSPLDFGFQPVGLYFDDKTRFRSRAVVHYGRRVSLRQLFSEQDLALINSDPQNHALVRKITDAMADSLRELLPQAPDVATMLLVRRIASLLVGKQRKVRVAEVYNWEVAVKEVVARLTANPSADSNAMLVDVSDYFAAVEKLDIDDAMIRYLARSPTFPWLAVLQRGLRYWTLSVLASPLILLGMIAYWPVLRITGFIARKFAIDATEEATYKFFGGMILSAIFSVLYLFLAAWLLSYYVGFSWWVVLLATMVPPIIAFAALTYRDRSAYYRWELHAILSRRFRGQLMQLATLRNQLVERILQVYEAIS